MVLGPRRVDIIWKLHRNDSGIISRSLEIDLESFFNQKVNIWNMFLYMNSEKGKTSKSDFQILLLSLNSSITYCTVTG